MVKVRKSAKGEFLIIILAIVGVVAVMYGTIPGPPSINVQVTNNGRLIQNVTISCFQCVPLANDKWEGTIVLAGIPLDVKSGNSGSSTGMKFNLALATQIPQGSICSGYAINSSCFIPVNLPLSISFDIRKTSSGGYLQAVVYLQDGESFKFPSSSGGFDGVFDFQSG